jgi:hypothetical protein
MPTRNRASLLAKSVKTALAQTHSDFEIVVSNNCCDDDTEQVVRRIDSPRLRYVKTDRVLAMHDHWDFALEHAKGDYVTFLCDDDAIHPRLLEIAAGVMEREDPELIAWTYAIYTHPHWPDMLRRNTLKAGLYSNQIMRIDAAAALRSAFGMNFPSPFILPLMLNSLCRRSTLDQIRRTAGRVFPPTSPDYSSMVLMLGAVREYLWLDAPLVLAGTAPEGIGATEPGYGQAFQTYIEELGGATAWARHVPLRQQTSMNNIADSMLRARNGMASLRRYDLDWPTYYAQCRLMLEQRDRLQVASAEDWQEYRETLGRQAPGFDQRVEASLNRLRSIPSGSTWPVLGPVVTSAPAPCYVPPARGEKAGFRDIAECAEWLHRTAIPRSLDPHALADAVLECVGQRSDVTRVIVYGLGRFGGFVWHELAASLGNRGIELQFIDDQIKPDDDPRSGSLPGRSDMHATLIVVTPWEDDGITRRLETLRAERGRHFITWRDVARKLPGRTASRQSKPRVEVPGSAA